ncbi:MAG TPA: hypothetical protein PK858_09650, partial [Saprospiraceae bacterium]|nr:hypothetical protein [Saprospiraceae bacterium]
EFKWEDADGDGGNAPTIEDIILAPNTVYTAYLHVYDGSKEINDEIEAESNSHLFTFTVTGANVNIGALTKDGNGQPFGIGSTWTTGVASIGSVNIKLYHEPTDKNNTASPGGEIDLDITMPLKVQ